MSHWYRIPRAIPISTLLFRMKRNFILDDGMPEELARYLPEGTRRLREFGDPKKLSHQEVVHICQLKGGILVTADGEYALLLNADGKEPWGVVLLPQDGTTHLNILRRLAAGRLVFRPSGERGAMLEYARHNRLLLDIRHNPPTVTVHSSCRWLGEPD